MLQLPSDGEPFQAVLEFVTVGNVAIAFLSGSVRGGGHLSDSLFYFDYTHRRLAVSSEPFLAIFAEPDLVVSTGR